MELEHLKSRTRLIDEKFVSVRGECEIILFYYESRKRDLKTRLICYMRIGGMKDSKTNTEESTRLTYTGLRHSCCHTYLETSVSQR